MEITGTLHLAARSIDELSGGERQRVIIARALAQQPGILLLDEPMLHPDIKHQLEILELVRRLAREKGLMVIVVSHDLELAMRYSDRLLLLEKGRIFSTGPPGEVITVENIQEVYGVSAEIIYGSSTGAPHVILKLPVDLNLPTRLASCAMPDKQLPPHPRQSTASSNTAPWLLAGRSSYNVGCETSRGQPRESLLEEIPLE